MQMNANKKFMTGVEKKFIFTVFILPEEMSYGNVSRDLTSNSKSELETVEKNKYKFLWVEK